MCTYSKMTTSSISIKSISNENNKKEDTNKIMYFYITFASIFFIALSATEHASG